MAILVLGLGNSIMTDDGFGVRVIEQLQARYRWTEKVRLLAGETLGLALLPRLAGIERLLVIDTVAGQDVPGTLVRLAGAELPCTPPTGLSLHQLGLGELLALAGLEGVLPGEVVVWGVEPASLAVGSGLTPAVAAAVEPAVAAVVDELRRWGVSCTERSAAGGVTEEMTGGEVR